MDFKPSYGMEFVILSHPKVRVLGDYSGLLRPGTVGYLSKSYVRHNFNHSIEFFVINVYRKGHSDNHIFKRIVVPTTLNAPGSNIIITKITPTKTPAKSDHIYKTLSMLSAMITKDEGIRWANNFARVIREHYKLLGIGVPIGLRRNNNIAELNECSERTKYVCSILLNMCGGNPETRTICNIIHTLSNNFNAAAKKIRKNLKLLSGFNDAIAKATIEVRARSFNLNYGDNDNILDISTDNLIKQVVNDSLYNDYRKLVSFEHKFNRR